MGIRAQLSTAETNMEANRVDQVTDIKMAEGLAAKIQQLSDELTTEKVRSNSRHRQSDLEEQENSLTHEREEPRVPLKPKTSLARSLAEVSQAETAFDATAAQVRTLNDLAQKLRSETEEFRSELDATRTALMNGIRSLASHLKSRVTRIPSSAANARRAPRCAAGEQSEN